MEVIVKTEGIAKEFSSVRVLNDISVEIRAGEVFGIIGENGAGKSTFIKILAGLYQPTAGKLWFDGKAVEIRNPADARGIGISLIPQEFNLVSDLCVYENIFLGEELVQKNGFLDIKAMVSRTRQLLSELDVSSIDPYARIQDLSVAQKQMVEIAKAIAFDSRFLIMDEPTTMLTSKEVEILFRLIERLKAHGVTIVYISHKLKEVKRICDRVMVLRDGEFISLEEIANIGIDEMARRMVGRELKEIFPEKKPAAGEVVLSVHNLSVEGLLHDISFDLHVGEVLGFAGLIGAGRTELAETIMGLRRAESGEISLRGKPLQLRKPWDAVHAGLSYLSEDRQGSGIITSFDVVKNITLTSLREYAKPFISQKAEIEKSKFYVDRFSIKIPSLFAKLEQLSGGNQQKVSLAKSIDTQPKIIIIDEPTRGIDVKAKRDIYVFVRGLANAGISVIFISSELEEIIGMCDRVLIMRSGRIVGELPSEKLSEEEIMYFATGIKGGY
ncbi:MAG: sugar ABC transporter ATP-binding protein [Rectinema sp.]|jgi:ribose transport system ATP-binding protein|uniref:Fused D-ribose transporter subunits of ABC superfamily: ATP-binding components n=1 Tax=uncultured spirochete TaxID=156406 RepID=A0A3P3XRX7_9SPIR|nr:fused D-ribose transporter subunits of ABC superfamily: ATP-binding components [uncultured spirochete]